MAMAYVRRECGCCGAGVVRVIERGRERDGRPAALATYTPCCACVATAAATTREARFLTVASHQHSRLVRWAGRTAGHCNKQSPFLVHRPSRPARVSQLR